MGLACDGGKSQHIEISSLTRHLIEHRLLRSIIINIDTQSIDSCSGQAREEEGWGSTNIGNEVYLELDPTSELKVGPG